MISFENASSLLKRFGISISPTGLWKWIQKLGDKVRR